MLSILSTYSPFSITLQQCLPLAVLKHHLLIDWLIDISICCNSAYRLRYWNLLISACNTSCFVATVLTACGIETSSQFSIPLLKMTECCNSAYRLRYWNFPQEIFKRFQDMVLQQCLPLAVLKLFFHWNHHSEIISIGCNSAYRLRYWNSKAVVGCAIPLLQQCLPLAVLKPTPKLNGYVISKLQQCLPLAVLKLPPR